jgi:D-alanyl-D-alanine carboxypeptidase (penicillin-binding protein 5/6)
MPASTTKLITALVAWNEFDREEKVVIDTGTTIGQSLRFSPGEVMTVRDLVKALLISSANDAALALANHYPESGYQGFVAAMNQFADNLNLTQSHFVNVSGLESPGHTMSARDLAVVADYLLSDPELAAIVDTTAASVVGESGRVYPLRTTNQLLSKNPSVYGIKTGWTDNAGECLVAGMKIDDQDVLTVVLGSQDRFGETEALLAWGDSVLRELALLR